MYENQYYVMKKADLVLSDDVVMIGFWFFNNAVQLPVKLYCDTENPRESYLWFYESLEAIYPDIFGYLNAKEYKFRIEEGSDSNRNLIKIMVLGAYIPGRYGELIEVIEKNMLNMNTDEDYTQWTNEKMREFIADQFVLGNVHLEK